MKRFSRLQSRVLWKTGEEFIAVVLGCFGLAGADSSFLNECN